VRLFSMALLALYGAGCRGDVDGVWLGEIGQCDEGTDDADAQAKVDLEQSGASIAGEVCRCGACGFITSGRIEDDDLTLDYGCGSCTLPSTTLKLELDEGAEVLEGDGWMNACDCAAEDCACRMGVTLRRRQ